LTGSKGRSDEEILSRLSVESKIGPIPLFVNLLSSPEPDNRRDGGELRTFLLREQLDAFST
jgi:hypothetical protein